MDVILTVLVVLLGSTLQEIGCWPCDLFCSLYTNLHVHQLASKPASNTHAYMYKQQIKLVFFKISYSWQLFPVVQSLLPAEPEVTLGHQMYLLLLAMCLCEREIVSTCICMYYLVQALTSVVLVDKWTIYFTLQFYWFLSQFSCFLYCTCLVWAVGRPGRWRVLAGCPLIAMVTRILKSVLVLVALHLTLEGELWVEPLTYKTSALFVSGNCSWSFVPHSQNTTVHLFFCDYAVLLKVYFHMQNEQFTY